jgi:hypothetical protein
MRKRICVKRHAVTQPLDKSYRLIPLTQGQNAIVDVEDFERLSQWNWIALWNKTSKKFRATRTLRHMPMEHQILFPSEREEIDHVNLNTLDNRRENLRRSTHKQNAMNRGRYANNTSGFKGVHWDKEKKRWRSKIYANNRLHYIGMFACKEKAARAYDEKAKKLHGEFAHLNFPLTAK